MEEKSSLDISKEDFPGNQNERREKLEPIAKGKTRKKPLLKRLFENFLSEDVENVNEYLVTDVFIPALKNTISELISQGVEMALFGEAGSRSSKRNNVKREGPRTYVSYSAYYTDKNGRTRQTDRHVSPRTTFDDILFERRSEAEDVLSAMVDLVTDYGQVTVADFYDLCGIDSVFTDNNRGWLNLSSAHVERCRDGYIIDLPRIKALD